MFRIIGNCNNDNNGDFDNWTGYSCNNKVSYTKTEYGYYITVYTSNGKGGYRLTLDGQSKDYGLESIGDGNPYSEDGYSASSSLE